MCEPLIYKYIFTGQVTGVIYHHSIDGSLSSRSLTLAEIGIQLAITWNLGQEPDPGLMAVYRSVIRAYQDKSIPPVSVTSWTGDL